MRRFHFIVGAIGVTAFLISGRMLEHHQPPPEALSDSANLMLRSRHIYILASGLVNLMLGLYVRRMTSGWREGVQMIGSGLLAASTALLIGAFIVEPAKGFQPEMWWSHTGLYALFGGAMAHFAGVVSEK